MQLSRTSTLLFQFGLVLVVTVAAGCGDSSILERAMGVDRSGSSGVHGQVAGGVPDANLAVASSAAEVIVQLAEGVDPDAFSGEYGSEVLRSIPELNLFVLAIPSAASSAGFLDVLNEDPSVTFAETNAVALAVEGLQGSMAFDEGLHDWQGVLDQDVLRRLRVSDAQAVSRGSGVIVAILDTGIDLDHAALAAHLLLPGVEFGVPHLPGDDRPQQVDTNGDGIVDGALGHGTHVGGIVHVVAPEAKLLPVRVLDSDGVGNAFDVSMGLVAATLRGASIVNLSLRLSDPSRAVETALDFADRNRVLVVAPAGNGGVAEVPSPAAHPIVIAVAGVDAADRKAAFSNFGAEVDLAAPSVGIVSTYAGGSYAAWSGTSMAAPFVTGTAALLCGSGSSDPREIRSWLTSAATSLESSEPTYAWGLGSGRLDAFESTLLAYRMEVEGKPTPSQIGF